MKKRKAGPGKGDGGAGVPEEGTTAQDLILGDGPWIGVDQILGAALPHRSFLGELPDGFLPSDQGNAERFVATYADVLRFVPERGWFRWDGTRWEYDERNSVQELAKRRLVEPYTSLVPALNPDDQEALTEHLIDSQRGSRIREMIRLASSDVSVVQSLSDFDENPDLINLENCILDLSNGRVLAHDPAYLQSRRAPVRYAPDAKAPVWERFLREIFQEKQAIIEHMQEAVGYSLTGHTREQAWWFMHGAGANGKTTFTKATQAILGDYQATADRYTFTEQRIERIPEDLARLAGRRAVFVPEPDGNRRLAASLIKQFTGDGEAITARFLRQPSFEFIPKAKLWMYGNERPPMGSDTYGDWRRLRAVPFEVRFSDDPAEIQAGAKLKDGTLAQKLQSELPGIFNWVLAGARRWYENGLSFPEEVQHAVEEYKEESDSLAGFLASTDPDDVDNEKPLFVFGPDYAAQATALYKAYKDWCTRANEKPINQTKFGRALENKGYKAFKNGVKYRRGLNFLRIAENPLGGNRS